MPRRLRSILAALALATVTLVAGAQENQAAVYQQGQSLYTIGKHAEAAEYFGKVIDGPSPALTETLLVAKGRMIIAASDMWLGKKADAIDQFELIYKLDPTFEPDDLLFPKGVIDEYHRTRERLDKAAATAQQKDQTRKDLEHANAEIAVLKRQMDGLRAYASQELVVSKRSRVVASIPLGVGQFYNGETTLGIIFLSTEVIALGTALISFGIHETIPSRPDDPDRARSVELTSRVVNWISSGAFVALAVGGVVQAQLAFVRESSEPRARPIPTTFGRVTPVFSPLPGGGFVGLGAVF